nr:hypothetical protein CFP56_22102 [Quercus suber]
MDLRLASSRVAVDHADLPDLELLGATPRPSLSQEGIAATVPIVEMAKKSHGRKTNAKDAAHKASTYHPEASTNGSRVMPLPAIIPSIAEHDLLEFQYVHFGDKTKPEHWFIDAETALSFYPDMDSENDELGYYDDGVRRTLTDDQIAMFRHSEVQELLRDCRLQREEQEYQMRIPALEPQAGNEKQPVSPVSHDSSLEDELADASRMHSLRPPMSKRQLSPSSRSDTSRSTSASIKRQRKQEVPYEQRKKRNWEQYIQGEDEQHGSITQRRLAREMDEQHTQEVMMDYGEDESVPSKSEQVSTTSTRRAPVSYEDL